MNDQNASDEQHDNQAEPDGPTAATAAAAETATATDQEAEPAPQKPVSRFLPSTDAGRTRLVAAGIAGAFLLAGGLGGFTIGQANDGPDHREMGWHGGFDGRGPGGR